jgi:hypothetical protein
LAQVLNGGRITGLGMNGVGWQDGGRHAPSLGMALARAPS